MKTPNRLSSSSEHINLILLICPHIRLLPRYNHSRHVVPISFHSTWNMSKWQLSTQLGCFFSFKQLTKWLTSRPFALVASSRRRVRFQRVPFVARVGGVGGAALPRHRSVEGNLRVTASVDQRVHFQLTKLKWFGADNFDWFGKSSLIWNLENKWRNRFLWIGPFRWNLSSAAGKFKICFLK